MRPRTDRDTHDNLGSGSAPCRGRPHLVRRRCALNRAAYTPLKHVPTMPIASRGKGRQQQVLRRAARQARGARARGGCTTARKQKASHKWVRFARTCVARQGSRPVLDVGGGGDDVNQLALPTPKRSDKTESGGVSSCTPRSEIQLPERLQPIHVTFPSKIMRRDAVVCMIGCMTDICIARCCEVHLEIQ